MVGVGGGGGGSWFICLLNFNTCNTNHSFRFIRRGKVEDEGRGWGGGGCSIQ